MEKNMFKKIITGISFAAKYTDAWCSQDVASVSAFFFH